MGYRSAGWHHQLHQTSATLLCFHCCSALKAVLVAVVYDPTCVTGWLPPPGRCTANGYRLRGEHFRDLDGTILAHRHVQSQTIRDLH